MHEQSKDPGDKVFMAGVLSRISDSIVRAVMAELRLTRTHDEMAQAREELKRVFQIIGWPHQP